MFNNVIIYIGKVNGEGLTLNYDVTLVSAHGIANTAARFAEIYKYYYTSFDKNLSFEMLCLPLHHCKSNVMQAAIIVVVSRSKCIYMSSGKLSIFHFSSFHSVLMFLM